MIPCFFFYILFLKLKTTYENSYLSKKWTRSELQEFAVEANVKKPFL